MMTRLAYSDDDDDVSDVAHPQTIVNVDVQRQYVNGNVTCYLLFACYLLFIT